MLQGGRTTKRDALLRPRAARCDFSRSRRLFFDAKMQQEGPGRALPLGNVCNDLCLWVLLPPHPTVGPDPQVTQILCETPVGCPLAYTRDTVSCHSMHTCCNTLPYNPHANVVDGTSMVCMLLQHHPGMPCTAPLQLSPLQFTTSRGETQAWVRLYTLAITPWRAHEPDPWAAQPACALQRPDQEP